MGDLNDFLEEENTFFAKNCQHFSGHVITSTITL